MRRLTSAGFFVLASSLSATAFAEETPASGEDKDGVRFRGGFLAPSIGPAFADGDTGVAIGLFKVQLGVQINHYFGVIYDGGPFFEAFGSADAAGAGWLVPNSALAVLSIGKTVYLDVGAGPSLDIYAFTDTLVDPPSAGALGTGAAPGLATKVALGFGAGPDAESARRVAFKLSVDPHFTFMSSMAIVAIPIGLGVEWF